VILGLPASPIGVISRVRAARAEPDWVSAKPRRFTWTLGMGMSLAMAIITNSDVHGLLPRTICLICLTMMWLESVLGVCLGCEFHAFLVRRGWTEKDSAFEICVNGVCEIPARILDPAESVA